MPKAERIQAVDIMRGLTIAWMILVNNPGGSSVFAPLKHAAWNGLTPTDLAFPFFMFIMGVSICFSMRRYQASRAGAVRRIIVRSLLIYLIGVALCCAGPLARGTFSLEGIRILGVLQRLAIVYFAGALIYLFVPRRIHLPLAFLFLLAYILILQFGDGYVHSARNLCARVDVALLGASHMITEKGIDGRFAFEPEGILSTLPCFAHVLFGTFAGRIVLEQPDHREKVRRIAVFGALLLFGGYLLQYLDPINKKLWTSSFVLVTCGAGALLLSLLINLCDVGGKSSGGGFFKVFGTNALLAYILSQLLNLPLKLLGPREYLVDRVLVPAFGPYWGSLAYSLLFVLLIWIIVYPLYRKKIFFRV